MSESSGLVIVESPAKCKTISALLGDGFRVIATKGHIMDLDDTEGDNKMGIEIDNDFNPIYTFTKNYAAFKSMYKKMHKKGEDIFIASDMDREGEFIAYSVLTHIGLKKPYKRVVFNEITGLAIWNAISNPGLIDEYKLNAQKARRILDKIYGYTISGLLRRIPELNVLGNSLGCGRVQSAIVKLIVDKENEITKFYEGERKKTFVGKVVIEDIDCVFKGFKTTDMNVVTKLIFDIGTTPVDEWKIIKIKHEDVYKSPHLPFTTTTLQTTGSKELNCSIKMIMSCAQSLYEKGYITYMRTDSYRLSEKAINDVENYLKQDDNEGVFNCKSWEKLGAPVVSGQDAHEAIRPTDIMFRDASDELDGRELDLYTLIWHRTIMACSIDAKYNKVIFEVDNRSDYNAVGWYEILDEAGYLLYSNKSIFRGRNYGFEKEMVVEVKKMLIEEVCDSQPQRYSETSLVKQMEKKGIGRPATYVSMIEKIRDQKNYVITKNCEGSAVQLMFMECCVSKTEHKWTVGLKPKKLGQANDRIVPTPRGILVNKFMEEYFPDLINVDFTSRMEGDLDKIMSGELVWNNVIREFYDTLMVNVDRVKKVFAERPVDRGIIASNDIIIGEFKGINIVFFKYKGKYKIKWDKVWIDVGTQPTKSEAIELLTEAENKPKSELIKKVGTYMIKVKNGSYFIQSGTKKPSFAPLKASEIDTLTIAQCREKISKTKK